MASVILNPKNRAPVLISDAERRWNITLSQSARDILSIPIDEIIISGGVVDWQEVEDSIRKIFDSISTDEHGVSSGPLRSQVVIRAFWDKFCDIPPFCNPRPATRGFAR